MLNKSINACKTMEFPSTEPMFLVSQSLKVAVIGAGLAGLVAAHELKREGHQVVVFEKADRLGGTWLYDPRVDSDQLSGNIIHGSLYFSLRTNLPRQLMGFSDYPLTTREIGDARTFPGHEEILRFLNDFANEFGIVELIRFRNEVVRVEPVDLGNEWVVESRMGELDLVSELFEAVVVCNGHYTEPIVAHLPGIAKWPGKQVHSHNYRHPTPYKNQVVVIIGKGPSAFDISREIAKVAKEVHISTRSLDIINVSKVDNHNMWQHSKIINVCEDGIIQFQDGTSVLADTILHCSGYNYSFPFLKTNGALSIEEKRVGPLYKHVFPPSLAPRVSFIGLHGVSITSLVSELQAKWIAKVLSGKLRLPSEEEMLIDVEIEYHCLQECGIPKHKTHELGSTEFGYQDWLAAEIGVPKIDKKLTSMFTNVFACLFSQKEAFRDNFDPEKVW